MSSKPEWWKRRSWELEIGDIIKFHSSFNDQGTTFLVLDNSDDLLTLLGSDSRIRNYPSSKEHVWPYWRSLSEE